MPRGGAREVGTASPDRQRGVYTRLEHELLDEVLQSIDFPLYVIDADTYEIVLANRAAYPSDMPGPASGRSWSAAFSPGTYFRMLMVGYFEGIHSQRGIAWPRRIGQ